MRLSGTSVIIPVSAMLIVGALVWTIVRDRGSEPYSVDRTALSQWTIVAAEGSEPWVVAVRPPAALTTSLFKQVSQKIGRSLVASPDVTLPLVMRPEFVESLQGVYDMNSIVRMARNSGIETATFEPVCLARRVDSRSASSGELVFVAFSAPEFWELRRELQPDFPEHAGTGIFDPGAVTPVLPIAATDSDFGRWWPLAFDQAVDCQAQLFVK